MSIVYGLYSAPAEAFRQGRMRQHFIPAADTQPPVVPGATIAFEEIAPFGKRVTLGQVQVQHVERLRLDDVSDDEIRACGFPNWTLFSVEWTRLHGSQGFSWDVDPDVWVIRFSTDR